MQVNTNLGNRFVNRHQTGKDDDKKNYKKEFKDQIEEFYERNKNGDTEPKFQIGSQALTEKEWDRMLARFDKAEREIKEAVEEKSRKELEQQETQNLDGEAQDVKQLEELTEAEKHFGH